MHPPGGVILHCRQRGRGWDAAACVVQVHQAGLQVRDGGSGGRRVGRHPALLGRHGGRSGGSAGRAAALQWRLAGTRRALVNTAASLGQVRGREEGAGERTDQLRAAGSAARHRAIADFDIDTFVLAISGGMPAHCLPRRGGAIGHQAPWLPPCAIPRPHGASLGARGEPRSHRRSGGRCRPGNGNRMEPRLEERAVASGELLKRAQRVVADLQVLALAAAAAAAVVLPAALPPYAQLPPRPHLPPRPTWAACSGSSTSGWAAPSARRWQSGCLPSSKRPQRRQHPARAAPPAPPTPAASCCRRRRSGQPCCSAPTTPSRACSRMWMHAWRRWAPVARPPAAARCPSRRWARPPASSTLPPRCGPAPLV